MENVILNLMEKQHCEFGFVDFSIVVHVPLV